MVERIMLFQLKLKGYGFGLALYRGVVFSFMFSSHATQQIGRASCRERVF